MKEQTRERELGRLLADLDVEGKPGAAKRGVARRKKEEPETISDLEDADEAEDGAGAAEEGGMVSPDEDDDAEDEDADADEGGLAARYKRALRDTGGGPSEEDFSFAKYLHKANIG